MKSANVNPCNGWIMAIATTFAVDPMITQRKHASRTSERERAGWSDQVQEPRAENKEHDHFRRHGFRPQYAGGSGTHAGGAPADDGKSIKHRVTAEDEGGDQHDTNKDRQPQQGSERAGFDLEPVRALVCSPPAGSMPP